MKNDIAKIQHAWREKFPDAKPDEIRNLGTVLAFLRDDEGFPDTLVGRQQAAYLLATVRHETAFTFLPIDERGGPDYFKKLYGPATRIGRQLGNKTLADAVDFRGRGYVQLTGRANYEKFSKMLGIDLAGYPDFASFKPTAYAIISRGMREGLFTGYKLDDYFKPGKSPQFIAARRIINGSDKASTIAGYAFAILSILENA